MGYDVSVELRGTDQREAYDAAAERLRIQHDIDTWGDEEPSDWQVKTLWSGGSAMRDLAEFLSRKGNKVEGEDGYCPSYVVPTDELIALGNIHSGLTRRADSIKAHMAVIESLGMVSDEDTFEYWHNLEHGVTSKTSAYVPIPVVRSIDLPDLHGSFVHDDEAAPVPHGNKKAWDAYIAHIAAERDLADAKGKFEAGTLTADELKLAVKKGASARADFEAIRPHQDTFVVRGSKLNVNTCDHDISIELEHTDPIQGAQFKATVIRIICEEAKDAYDVHDLYEILSDNPGTMLMAFQRLGEIGEAAKRAHIDELVINPSW